MCRLCLAQLCLAVTPFLPQLLLFHQNPSAPPFPPPLLCADYSKLVFGPHAGPVVSLSVSPFLPELLLSVGDWTFRLWYHGLDSQVPLFVSPQTDDTYTAGGFSLCTTVLHGAQYAAVLAAPPHGSWTPRIWVSTHLVPKGLHACIQPGALLKMLMCSGQDHSHTTLFISLCYPLFLRVGCPCSCMESQPAWPAVFG